MPTLLELPEVLAFNLHALCTLTSTCLLITYVPSRDAWGVCGNIVAPRRWVPEICIGSWPRLARAIGDRAGPKYLGTTSDACVPRIPQSSAEHLRDRSQTHRPLSRPPYPARPLRSGDLPAGVGAHKPCKFRNVAPQPRELGGVGAPNPRTLWGAPNPASLFMGGWSPPWELRGLEPPSPADLRSVVLVQPQQPPNSKSYHLAVFWPTSPSWVPPASRWGGTF